MRREAALLALALCSYGYFHAPAAWNETSRYDLVRAIVERGALDIDAYHANTGDKAFQNGHYYSDKAPGVSFLAVPSYAVYYAYLHLSGRTLPAQLESSDRGVAVNLAFRNGMFVCCFFSVVLVAVLGMAAFHRAATRLGVDGDAALLATLALMLGSLLFPYATLYYGHVPCALLLFCAAAWVARQERAGAFDGRSSAVAGLLAALATVTEYPAALPALGLAAWTGLRSPRALAAFAAGAAAPLVLLGAYDTACFGAPWRTGYALVSDPAFAAGMRRGFMGLTHPSPVALWQLTFGAYRGLFLLNPVLLMSGAGAWRLYKAGYRAEMAVCAAMVAYFLLLNASYYMWWGGSATGPRHAIPMLPFLALPLVGLGPGRARQAAWALLGLSIAIMLVVTAVGPEPPERLSPVLAFHLGHFAAGRVAVNSGSSNLGLRLGLNGRASLVPLGLGWAACAAWLWRLRRAETGQRRSTAYDPGS